MAGVDKKLTDLTELTTPSNNAFIHVVEPFDISQSPEGSSFKVKKSNFGGLSDAPSDGETYGRKDGAWEIVGGGEVLTTNTNITSSVLSTQNVAGFVDYINGLVSSFAVAENEIRTYTVTDTGQKFEILLRGRSFGGSEPDILSSDVLELDRPENYKVISQTSAAAHTGALGNVTIASIVIAPNDWNTLDMVEIRSVCRRTTAVGNISLRYNITDGVTSQVIALYTQTSTQSFAPFERLRFSMDSGGVFRGSSFVGSLINDSAISATANSVTLNKANNITISISIQLADITDSITLDSFSVTLRRKY